MADYIYLLETRLSPAQQGAIGILRTAAREAESTIFLTGGAVRDLTGGGSIRDLDLTLQGDPLKLKKMLENAGARAVGESAVSHQLFLVFPGGVRVELAAAMSVTFPKPGKPKYELSNITDDLRRRDFTANAMAISLNEGSYGLLMDPLNGVADIENRELRLVNNYGFIEDPARLIRAARLQARLSWQMEEKTRQRYETAKEEGYISALSPWSRGYELEEIFHEEDPVRVLRALEAEGWMSALSSSLSAAKANTSALAELADKQGQLQVQGILSQSAALAFPLITGKMPASDIAALKELFVRPGFAQEIDTIEAATRDFATKFSSKEFASPSAAWKLLHSAEPNLVLALFYSSKSSAVQARLKTFLADSPSARQRIPYALMSEMRITPDLPAYAELIDKLFFELMDGKLSTPEEMKAYLEPFSPPAPPPPVNLRRARARKEARPSRAKSKKAVAEVDETISVAAEEELVGIAEGIMEEGDLTGPDRGPEPTVVTPIAKVAPEITPVVTPKKIPSKKTVSAPAPVKAAPTTAKAVAVPVKAASAKQVPAAGKSAPAPVKAAPAKKAVKPPAKKAPPVKAAPPKKAATPAKKTVPLKTVAKKSPVKVAAKKAAPTKAATKKAPAKNVPAKKAVPVKTPAKKTVPAKKSAPAKKAPAKVAKKAAKTPGRR